MGKYQKPGRMGGPAKPKTWPYIPESKTMMELAAIEAQVGPTRGWSPPPRALPSAFPPSPPAVPPPPHRAPPSRAAQVDAAFEARNREIAMTVADVAPKLVTLRVLLWHTHRNQPRRKEVRDADAQRKGLAQQLTAGVPGSAAAGARQQLEEGGGAAAPKVLLPGEAEAAEAERKAKRARGGEEDGAGDGGDRERGRGPRGQDPPSWVVHVQGKCYEEDVVESESRHADHTSPTGYRTVKTQSLRESELTRAQQGGAFSHLLRSLRVELLPLDGEGDGPGEVFTWEKHRHVGEQVDAFELRRAGTQSARVRVTLDVDSAPALYRVAGALRDVCPQAECTKQQAIHAVWKYVKEKGLQDIAEPMKVRPDDWIRGAFGDDVEHLYQIGERVGRYLEALPPVVAEHVVDLSQPSPGPVDVCNVRVAVGQVTANEEGGAGSAFLKAVSTETQSVAETTKQLNEVVDRIDRLRRQRAFLAGFSDSPVDFVTQMMAVASQDVRVDKNAPGGDQYVVGRPSEIYTKPWAHFAALRYLFNRHEISTGKKEASAAAPKMSLRQTGRVNYMS